MSARRWELYWRSTATERYNTELNDRVDQVMILNNIRVTGSWGGTDLTSQESDNALLIEGDRGKARLARRLLQHVVHREVTLTEITDDD